MSAQLSEPKSLDKSIDWIARSQSLSFQVRNFVGGGWRGEGHGELIEKYNPRDGRLLCRLRATRAEEVDEAVATARRAFEDGRWSKLPAQRRKEVLLKLVALIEEHREELALLECLDVGKPISDALNIDVPMAAASIRYSAEAADKVHGRVYAADQRSLSYQLHRARGVVGAIVGWNFPLVLAAGKIGRALAVGNCLVLKPSEVTSFSASRLAELAATAGVPDGVFNVIHGDARTGAALASHRGVDLLAFTGSTSTGRKLLIAAGESNMKRTLLECGGKAPNIVFDDCPDLDAVAEAVVRRAFWNQGEVCTASSRLLVHERIKADLLRRVIAKTGGLQLGDPLHPDTRFGALVSQAHKNKVLDYVRSGEQDGARIVHRSDTRAPFQEGFYVPPTILDGVSSEHTVAQEEIFGPVLSVLEFADEDEAIRIANSTVYGLSAILWTTDMGRAHRMTQGIDAGWIVVNATANPTGGPGAGVLSIGGHKESGIGAEGGIEGLEAYMSKTSVQYFV